MWASSLYLSISETFANVANSSESGMSVGFKHGFQSGSTDFTVIVANMCCCLSSSLLLLLLEQ